MALFRRPPQVPDTVPDEAFPFWSGAQADEFRVLVRESFTRHGSEVVMHADHAVDGGGRQFGFGNLAGACHNDDRGRRAWPEIIDGHISSLLDTMDGPSPWETWSSAEVLSATFQRVVPTEDLLPWMSYAREIAPGLAQVFNLDLPTSVTYLTDEHVERFGAQELRAAGLANLRRVQADERHSLDHGGGHVDVLLGDSMFTASLLLVLDEVVARYGYRIDPELGVFVAVPFRHQLNFHVLADATVIPSLNTMTGFAAAGFRDSAGPVSPNVYWWRAGQLEQVSRSTPDGPVVEVGSELAAVLERLAGR
jgi:hypothetical protein